MSDKSASQMLGQFYQICFQGDGQIFDHLLVSLKQYVVDLASPNTLKMNSDSYLNGSIARNEKKLADVIAFAENLRLSEMRFVVVEGEPDFLIQRENSEEEVEFSNRDSRNGEMRGALLRTRLTALKNQNGALTLADALRLIYGEKKFSTSSEAIYVATGVMSQMDDEYIDSDYNRQVFRATVQPFIAQLGEQLIEEYGAVLEVGSDSAMAKAKDSMIETAKACFHQPHSYWHTRMIEHNQLSIKKLKTMLDGEVSPTTYQILSDVLRENSDAQFNIVSRLNSKGEWVRDATYAMSLEAREAAGISNDSPVIVANNMLLRCLARLRAIDYAIEKKYESSAQKGEAHQIRLALQAEFKDLMENTLGAAQHSTTEAGALSKIKALEVDFDKYLIQELHEANLAQGVKTEQAAEKLLNRYRNLSSVLTPARTLVTLTYDTRAGVFQRETQYPVTKKTTKQKEAVASLMGRTAYDSAKAADEADRLFLDLMAEDDRALPAQTRKTHLIGGAKNAFLVKNELIFDVAPEDLVAQKDKVATDEHTLWLGRMGTPVYVGTGETEAAVAAFTRENINQMRGLAQEKMGKAALDVHFTTLNTDSPLENQSTMIAHLYDATRRDLTNQDTVSYVPTNTDGTFRLLDIAPGLYPSGEAPAGSAPLDKATRAQTAADVILKAAEAGYLSTINCASGQDRTGTEVEAATQDWTKAQYAGHGFLDSDNVSNTRAAGAHAAEASTHLLPGSPMMKRASRAGQLFSEAVTNALYGKSAKTNKASPVTHDDSKLRKLKDKVMNTGMDDAKYVETHHLAMLEYEQNMKHYEAALAAYAHSSEIYRVGRHILEYAERIGGAAKVKTNALAEINQVLFYCTAFAKNPNDVEVALRLQALSETASGKASPIWQNIAKGLLICASIALVVAVVATLAFFTGGLGLLVPLAAVTGLSLIKTAGVCAVGGGVMLGASVLAEKQGAKKGLARDVEEYASLSSNMQAIFHHKDSTDKTEVDETGASQALDYDEPFHPKE